MPPPTLLLVLLLSVAMRLPGSGRALILLDDEWPDRPARLLHHLSAPAIDDDCDRAAPEAIPVEGYFKMTTAPAPLGHRKICRTPFVPSGARVEDARGIGFWFMRLRVTRLAPGQFLWVVNTDYENMHSMRVENDQRVDLSYDSHQYPVVLYLKYRYVRLYWNSSAAARLQNPVNITAAAYARFKEGLNQTVRRELCRQHGHAWCQRSRQPAGVCVAPGGCSERDDCFDAFEEPDRCPGGGFGGGNLTGLGSSGAGGGLPTGDWLLRRLRWLAFAALPLALVAALARLCAQKRRLDIDENYDYKPGEAEAEDADAIEAEDVDNDDERPLSDAAGGAAEAYYSYPSCPTAPPARAATVATLAASATVIPPLPPLPLIRSTPIPSSKASIGGVSDSVDSETGERDRRSINSSGVGCGGSSQLAPTPPPRSRRPESQLHRLVEEERGSLEERVAGAVAADADNKDDIEVCLRRSLRSPSAAAATAAASGDYTEWRSRRASVPSSTVVSSRCSYTRLLNQPSPDTIEELLRRSSASESPDRVVYAQLVLPPPSARRPPPPPRAAKHPPTRTQLLHFKAPSAPAAESGNDDRYPRLEMQPMMPRPPPGRSGGEATSRRPRGDLWADPYDLHYIVV